MSNSELKIYQKEVSPYWKLFQIIPSFIRRQFLISFLLMSVVGVMEVFSLAALFAFFNFGVENRGSWLSEIIDTAISPLVGNSKYMVLLVTLALFIFKSGLVLLVGCHSYWVATYLKKYFQDQIFEQFLRSPFQLLTTTASSEWVRCISVDCNSLEGRLFVPILVLIGEIIPALSICAVLFLVNSTVFMIAIGIFLIVGILVYLFTHKKFVALGREQQNSDGNIVNATQNAFLGLRELRIYGLQNWVKKNYRSLTESLFRATNGVLFLGLLPRFFFELATYVSLSVVVILYAVSGLSFEEAIGQLAIFGVSATRILPSVSKILSHLQSVKHSRPAVVEITKHLARPDSHQESNALLKQQNNFFDSLQLHEISYTWGQLKIFKSQINLEIKRGDFIAIVGPSGAGKSTLVNLILGLIQPSSGEIRLNNAPLSNMQEVWWPMVGYVAQEPFLINEDLISNVILGALDSGLKDKKYAEELLLELGFTDDFLEANQLVGENGIKLSGGQRQRVAIARALYRKPDVLILDEATSALDQVMQEKVMQIIETRMRNRTVVMVTHRTETLLFFNKIFQLPAGAIEINDGKKL